MAETGLADLLAIMKDPKVGMRNRVNAAVSASRVSALSLGGESEPPAIVFLKHVIDYEHNGERYAPQFRRESAAALAYWQRRCAKAQLQYSVPDADERLRQWRGVLNGCIRLHLGRRGLWPERKDILFGPTDLITMPPHDPELGLAALLYAGSRKAQRRRAIDERSVPTIASDAQRLDILRSLARVTHARLREFGLAQ